MNKNTWLLLVITIASSFAAITFWSIHRANLGVSAVTDPDYYRHGLKYNNTSIELKAAQAMGWRIAAALRDNNQLEITVRNKRGETVSGATAEVSLNAALSNRSTDQTLSLREGRPGIYSVPLPPQLVPPAYATIEIKKNGAIIQRRLLLNLSVPGNGDR